MLVVYGTAGIALAVLVFGVALIGSRNPVPAFWAGESLVANIYVPLIVVLAVLGIGCYLKFILTIGSQDVSAGDIGLAVGIAALGLVILKRLRIKEHLAAFDTVEKSAEIIKPAVFSSDGVEGKVPEPPANPTSAKKAA